MKLNRFMIEENFYNWIRWESLRYLKEPFSEREVEIINAIINDLCNLSVETMSILTTQETFVLRKYLGVYDNGEFQSFETIAKETGQTSSEIRKILLNMCSELIEAIFRGYYISCDKKTKMSSLTELEKYANFPFSKLGFDKKVNQMFYGTLYDFLSYSRADLSKMGFGNNVYPEIYFKIRNMGLKFIEDLTVEEKKAIIVKSSKEMIDNSSVAWVTDAEILLSGLKGNRTYGFCYHSFETIRDLKEFIENDDEAYREVTENMIRYAASVGIFLVDNFQTLENRCLTSKEKKLTDKYEELKSEYEALKKEYESLIKEKYYYGFAISKINTEIANMNVVIRHDRKLWEREIFLWAFGVVRERPLAIQEDELKRDKLVYRKELLQDGVRETDYKLTVIRKQLNTVKQQLEIVEQQLNSTKEEMEFVRTRKR